MAFSILLAMLSRNLIKNLQELKVSHVKTGFKKDEGKMISTFTTEVTKVPQSLKCCK